MQSLSKDKDSEVGSRGGVGILINVTLYMSFLYVYICLHVYKHGNFE